MANMQESYLICIFKEKKLDVLVWTMFTLEIWHRICGEGDKNYFN